MCVCLYIYVHVYVLLFPLISIVLIPNLPVSVKENLVVWLHLKFGDSLLFRYIYYNYSCMHSKFQWNSSMMVTKKEEWGKSRQPKHLWIVNWMSSLENKIRHEKIWSGIEEKYKIKWEIIIKILLMQSTDCLMAWKVNTNCLKSWIHYIMISVAAYDLVSVM